MLVTYILLSYNQEEFIHSSIYSIINQSYGHIEIIVSDDCSIDKSWDIILDISKKNNIKITKTPTNIGIIGNINHALALATGHIIIFMGGDDLSEPDRTSIIVNYFEEHPDVYGLYSSTIDITPNGDNINNSNYGLKYYKRNGKMTINSHLLNDLGMLGCSAAYRRCLLDEPLPFSLPSEDKTLTLRALLKGEVGFIYKPLVKYRLGTGISNNTNQRSLSQYIKRVYNTIRTYNGYLKDKSVFTKISNDDITNINRVIKYNETVISNIPFKFIRLMLYLEIPMREKIKSIYYLYIKRR